MLLVLSVLLVSADQFTKYLVRENLEIDEKITLIDGFPTLLTGKTRG